MDRVSKLTAIWEDIPKGLTEQIDLSQKEIINQYMDTFHFGDCFYVIFNTSTAQMEYVSPNVGKILGYEPQEFHLGLVMENIHPEDLPYYYHYEQAAVRFFSELPADLFYKYKFAYDYRLKTKNQEYKRLQQQIIPVYYFPTGGVRTLGVFTDLTHFRITGIPKLSFIGMEGAPSYYNVHLRDGFHKIQNIFTKREQEILKYIVQGKNSEEIANLLCRSKHTIQNHRKNILQKSGCTNLQELLVKSIRDGWV